MQTIGERLEEARKKKGISIREAAEATKIRGDYLQKLESNQFDLGLTDIYTRGFLRNYCGFLKLPPDRILNDYAALGRGDGRQPRQPNREIYGRMDVPPAPAPEPERAAPVAEENAPANAAVPVRPRYPRSGGSSLPSGPDPATIFKYTKWVGIGVGVILILWIGKAIFSSGPKSPTPISSSPRRSVTGSSYTLVAVGPVAIRVTNRIGADTDGEEIFKGTLLKGQTQVIPLTGPQNLWANPGDNLKIEWKGNLLPFLAGSDHVHMDPTVPR